MDGYPKTYKQADGVFIERPKAPERKMEMNDEGEMVPVDEIDEEELKQLLKPKFQDNIYPYSVILLRGEKQQIEEAVHKLSKEELSKSHWMPYDLERRVQEYS